MEPVTKPGTGMYPQPPSTDREAALRAVARELEATFLSEMLKHAGVERAPDAFGGGMGEEQFSSFLRDAQAKEIAAQGGIGLAESIFNSLVEKRDAE